MERKKKMKGEEEGERGRQKKWGGKRRVRK